MTNDEALPTLRQFRILLDQLLSAFPAGGEGPTLLEVLEPHLGVAPDSLPEVNESVPPYQFVDADLALESLAARDPSHRVIGVSAPNGATPSDSHLGAALDELLSDRETLTREMLGVRSR